METMLDLETIEKWDEIRGVVAAQINSKHNTQTRQKTTRTLQNKTKQIRNKHRQNSYITVGLYLTTIFLTINLVIFFSD